MALVRATVALTRALLNITQNYNSEYNISKTLHAKETAAGLFGHMVAKINFALTENKINSNKTLEMSLMKHGPQDMENK